MDLSEKHLAWFTVNALPEADEYPEGEYPFDEAQAGEGLHPFEGIDLEPLDHGGNYFMSTAGLASGVGVLKEKYAPYTNSEGNPVETGDWSLPEEERFSVSFEMKDANFLPAPSSFDENGSYVYRSAATEAIKSELMAGRPVAISFYADRSMPDLSIEKKREILENILSDNSSFSRDGAEAYNAAHEDEETSLIRYAKGIVNPGESFVSFEPDRWIDWSDAIDHINDIGANVYMAYDNLPVKAYVYPWAQVQRVHDLSHRIPAAGGEAAICPEDGYMLLDVAK